MALSKISEEMRAFYLRTLGSLEHPESFSIKDLVEAMFVQPTFHRGTRKDIPTYHEIARDLLGLPEVSRLGRRVDGVGRAFAVYSFNGGPRP